MLFGPWLHSDFSELPESVRSAVAQSIGTPGTSHLDWDNLSPSERRRQARIWDAQHPVPPIDEELAGTAFSRGYRIEVNAQNAKRRRPTRQLVSDADIVKMKSILIAENVLHHKQCSVARSRLVALGLAGEISTRSFRDRWIKLGLNKKKGG
jgi:hypothetical protein